MTQHPPKGERRGRHRREEEQPDKTRRDTTSKERRREAWQQQSRKVSVHYYETHNVKNRNRNKRPPTQKGRNTDTRKPNISSNVLKVVY